jgi:hypothetical protein
MIPEPTLRFFGNCPVLYHVEIWAEKSTVNGVLEPLAEQYGLNLQTALGEMSLTRCHEAVRRAAGNGNRPVRSDFDPAGQSIPVAAARKIEWLKRESARVLGALPQVAKKGSLEADRLLNPGRA